MYDFETRFSEWKELQIAGGMWDDACEKDYQEHLLNPHHYQLFTCTVDKEICEFAGMEPGLDPDHLQYYFEDYKLAELNAACACCIDFRDGAIVYGIREGRIMYEIGNFPDEFKRDMYAILSQQRRALMETAINEKYQLVTYLGQFAPDLGLTPGIDQRINYSDLATAKLAAGIACAIDLHDAATVYDRETGEILDIVGDFPFDACSVYE